MEVKISLIRFFIAVAETGNILDAAERVGRSPSAVSMALKQLEDDLGGKLFESDRKNRLTDLGEFLLDTARQQVINYDKMIDSVIAYANGEIGKIEFACVPSVAFNIIPEVIKNFMDEWPNVELDMRDTDTASVARAIKRGNIEFGIAGKPKIPGLNFTPLFRSKLVVVYPDNFELANRTGSIGLKELESQPIIANGIFDSVDNSKIQALRAKANLMVRNTTSLLGLVKSGAGITILPALSIPKEKSGFGISSLEGGQLKMDVGIILERDSRLSPAASSFLQYLSSYVTEKGYDSPSTT